jgi:hypothetical protein
MKTTNQEKQNTYKKKENENKSNSMDLTSVVSFRIKNDELTKLQKLANNENRSISNYLKTLIKSV